MTDKMKWISVKDELPNETAWCLVYGDKAMACRGWNKTRQQWEDWQDCQCPGLEMAKITHWRPLPGPPEKCLKDRFAEYLKQAGEMVRNWPSWKRAVLDPETVSLSMKAIDEGQTEPIKKIIDNLESKRVSDECWKAQARYRNA